MDIPPERLSPDVLRSLIEAFILREGTDYGLSEVGLEEKVLAVRKQLSNGKAKIVYDDETESCNIVSTVIPQIPVQSRQKPSYDNDDYLYSDVEYPED